MPGKLRGLPEQIEYLANIARLFREKSIETVEGSGESMTPSFPDDRYVDVPGV